MHKHVGRMIVMALLIGSAGITGCAASSMAQTAPMTTAQRDACAAARTVRLEMKGDVEATAGGTAVDVVRRAGFTVVTAGQPADMVIVLDRESKESSSAQYNDRSQKLTSQRIESVGTITLTCGAVVYRRDCASVSVNQNMENYSNLHQGATVTGDELFRVLTDTLQSIRAARPRLDPEGAFEEAHKRDPGAIEPMINLVMKWAEAGDFTAIAKLYPELRAANASGLGFSVYPEIMLAFDRIGNPEWYSALREMRDRARSDVKSGTGYFSRRATFAVVLKKLDELVPQLRTTTNRTAAGEVQQELRQLMQAAPE